MKMSERLERIALAIRVTLNLGYQIVGDEFTHDLPNTDDNHNLFVKVYVDDTDEPVVCNWYSEPALTISQCYNCHKHCKECKSFDNVCRKFLHGDDTNYAEDFYLCYPDYIPHYLWGQCELFPLITKIQVLNVKTQSGIECKVFNGASNSEVNVFHIKKVHYTGNKKKKTVSGGYKVVIHNK